MHFFHRLYVHSDWDFLMLRVVIGLIFIVHGISKWGFWSITPSDQMPASMLTIMKILSIAEPLGGLALILGFLTPIAALGLMIIMVGAIYFKINVFKVPFIAQNTTGWEFDLVLLVSNSLLFFHGAGKFSIDRLLRKRDS